MSSLKALRILIVLNILTIVADCILVGYYDPQVSPLVGQADNISEMALYAMSTFELSLLIIAFISLILTVIYSWIAIWIGHRSGKWAFLASIVLTEIATCFWKITTVTGLTMCVGDLSMMLTGAILAIAFLNSRKKVASLK